MSKRLIFVVAAAGAGVAGSLMALSTLRVQPDGVVLVLYIKRGLWGVFSRRGKVHLFPVGYRVRFDS